MKSLVMGTVIVLIMSGCASKESIGQVKKYAEKSVEIHKNILQVYDTSVATRHDAKLMTAVRDGSTINDLVPEKIENSGQRASLSNLVAFSEAIHVLASDDIGKQIDEETEKLNLSLTSLSNNPNIPAVNPSEIVLMSTGINAIGRAYTEYSRFKALKQVMRDSNSTVVETINFLRKDLPAWKIMTKISLENELVIQMYLLNNPNRCADHPSTTCVNFSHSIEDRLSAYRKASTLKVQINQLDDQFSALDKALESIANLHSAVIISLDSDDDVSIAAAKKAFASSNAQIKAIRAFQKNIKE